VQHNLNKNAAGAQPACSVKTANNSKTSPFNTKTWAGLNEYVTAIYGEALAKGVVWTTGMASVEGANAAWFGAAGLAHLEAKFPWLGADLYACIGVMRPGASARGNRNVVAQPLLIVDDIGTKIDRGAWNLLFAMGFPLPTARIETSPGNETWIWALAGDATDPARWVDLAVIRAWLVDMKLTDDVMDAARYIRLPGGHNSKAKYKTGGGSGVSPPVTLVDWQECRPSMGGARVDLDAVGVALLGVARWAAREFPATAAGRSQASSAVLGNMTGLVRSADLAAGNDALMTLAAVIGMNPVQIRLGVVEARCPNIAAHGDRADTGFAFLGDGLMHCNHASCQELSTREFRGMMEAEFERQAAAAPGGLLEGSASASGFMARQVFSGADAGNQVLAGGVVAGVASVAQGMAVASAAAAAARTTQNIATFLAQPFAPVGPWVAAQIPPRRWLYGTSAISGYITLNIAPGGAGKTALATSRAVAMASGKTLLPGESPIRPLRVWMHNAEDDLTEGQRRLAATLQHYGMTHADLNGNLFMTSGRDFKFQLARMGRDGPEIVPDIVDAIVERAKRERLDVIMLDPLGALHTLPENSNEAANLLFDALREIAHRAEVAVIVLHHTGKAAATDMDSAGAGASRGASAFVDAARVVQQIVRMTVKEMNDFRLTEEERSDLFRVENGKANLARRAGGRWVRMADVALDNGAGLWPLGDRVGVAERWTPPTPQAGTGADLARVQAALHASPLPARANAKSLDWIGYLIARIVGLDVGAPGTLKDDLTPAQQVARGKVSDMIDGWIKDGGLVRKPHKFPGTKGAKPHDAIFVGTPAILTDTDSAESNENYYVVEENE